MKILKTIGKLSFVAGISLIFYLIGYENAKKKSKKEYMDDMLDISDCEETSDRKDNKDNSGISSSEDVKSD